MRERDIPKYLPCKSNLINVMRRDITIIFIHINFGMLYIWIHISNYPHVYKDSHFLYGTNIEA